jgi:hypothetical protein
MTANGKRCRQNWDEIYGRLSLGNVTIDPFRLKAVTFQFSKYRTVYSRLPWCYNKFIYFLVQLSYFRVRSRNH